MSKATLPAPTRRLLTDKEAAAYCGVSVNTMITHIAIQPVRIGSCVRYDVRALDRWLDRKSNSAPMTADDWLERLDEDQGERA